MSEHQSDPISDDELDPDHPYNVPAVARTDIHGQPIPESAPHPAYTAALAADEAFEAALIQVYGKAKAADKRYHSPWIDVTPEQRAILEEAYRVKCDADTAWLKVMREGRRHAS